MIALSNDQQFLAFQVFAGSGNDKLEYTIHADGSARRLAGRSGGAVRSASVAEPLTAVVGDLGFGAVKDILQGPNALQGSSAVVHTITIHNPGSVEVEAAVLLREDTLDGGGVPVLTRRTLWRFTLAALETFTYTDGAGASIDSEESGASPARYGVLSGSTNGRPIIVTATTPGGSQTIHTVGGTAERVSIQAAANAPGPIAVYLRIGDGVGAEEWESTVGNRGPSVLIERAVLEVPVVIQVYAATTSAVRVMGGFERVENP